MSNCQIIRDKVTNLPVTVYAPNGEESELYKNAVANTENINDALKLWALAYTPLFKTKYGDWETGKTRLILDKNGEPLFKDVITSRKDFIKLARKSKVPVNRELLSGEDPYMTNEKAYQFVRNFNKQNPGAIAYVNLENSYTVESSENGKEITTMVRVGFKSIPKSIELSSNELQKQIQKVNTIMDKLVPKFKGLTYEWISPSDLQQKDHYENVNDINAFVRNNKIYLVEGRVDTSKGIEEVMHVFIEMLRQDKNSLFKGLFDAALEDPRFVADIENIKTLYKNSSISGKDVVIKSEFLTKALTKAFQEEIRNNKQGNKLSPFAKLIQRFLDWLSKLLDLKSHSPRSIVEVSLANMASYINTDNVEIPLPEEDYMYYSLIDSTTGPKKMDELADETEAKESKKTILDLHIERNQNSIVYLEKLKQNIIKKHPIGSPVKQLEALDILIKHLNENIENLKSGVSTISVSRYTGDKEYVKGNDEIVNISIKFGIFQHSLYEDLVMEHIDTDKTPSVIFTEKWFDAFYERHKKKILFKDPDKDLLREIGANLAARLTVELANGGILLPEISLGVEDIDNQTLLGRLDVLRLNKKGQAKVIDLKTSKSDFRLPNWSDVTFIKNNVYNDLYKEGVDPVFAEFKSKSKLDDYHMQVGVYTHMLNKIGIESDPEDPMEIIALTYHMSSPLGGTEATLTTAQIGTFSYFDMLGTSNGPALAIAIKSRFQPIAEEDIVEDDTIQNNPFSPLSTETKTDLITRLSKLIDDQISSIDEEIKEVERSSDIDKNAADIKKDVLLKRQGTLRDIKNNLDKTFFGEDDQSLDLAKAMALKLTLDVLKNELDIVETKIKESIISKDYEVANLGEKNEVLLEYTKNIKILDNIKNYIEVFSNIILDSEITDDQKEELNNYFSKNFKNKITTIKSNYSKVGMGIATAIIKKSIGQNKELDNKFTKVFGAAKKRWKIRYDWLQKKVAEMEAGEQSEEGDFGTRTKKRIGNTIRTFLNKPLVNKSTLEEYKKEIKDLEKLFTIDKLDDKAIEAYLNGIFNTEESVFYLGSTIAGSNSLIIPIDDLIASSMNSEMLISAVFQYMRNLTDTGSNEFLNDFIYKENIDELKNDFINSAGGLNNANNIISSEIVVPTSFNDDGTVKESKNYTSFETPYLRAYEFVIDSFDSRLNDFAAKLKTAREEFNKLTGTEKEQKNLEIKQLENDRELLSKQYIRWQIDNSNTRYIPEVMELMFSSGSKNADIAARMEVIAAIIREKGGDEHLDEDDIFEIQRLDSEIESIRVQMRSEDPDAAANIEKYLKYFKYSPNYGLWEKIRKSKEELYGENSDEYKQWMDLNSDIVPTEEWSKKIKELNLEKAELLEMDEELSILYKELGNIKSKYKSRGAFRGGFNFKLISPEDADRYQELMDQISAIQEFNRSSFREKILSLTDDEQIKWQYLTDQLKRLQKSTINPDYIKRKKELMDNVSKSWKELLRLQDTLFKAANAADKKNIQEAIEEQQKQYETQEAIFEEFFNKNNTVTYKTGSIANRKAIQDAVKSYLIVKTPVKDSDNIRVPNKKYRMKRLTNEAYNPSYQESFSKKRFSSGSYAMPKGFSFDTTTNTFSVDSDSPWVNPKFLAIQSDSKSNEFYNKWIINNFLLKQENSSGRPLGFFIPYSQQRLYETLATKGVAGLKREYEQTQQELSYMGSELEKATNESGLMGQNQILFPSNRLVETEKNTADSIGSIVEWNRDLYINRKMAAASLETGAVLDFLEGIKIKLEEQSKKEEVAQITTIIDILKFERNKFVYGQLYEKGNQNASVFNRKTARMMMHLAAISRMAADIPMQIGNLLAGNVQAWMSAQTCRHSSPESYLKAKGLLYGRFLGHWLADWGKLSNVSFETKLLRAMNPSQKDLKKQMDANTANRVRRLAGRLTNLSELATIIQDKGEFEISAQTMLQIMVHQKYKVLETNPDGTLKIENDLPVMKLNSDGTQMYVDATEIFRENTDGQLVLREDVDISLDELSALKGKIWDQITLFQGNYSKNTRSKFGGTLLGTLYDFYRKYLIPNITARFGGLNNLAGYKGIGSAYSWDAGDAGVGYYTSMYEMFKYFGKRNAFKTLLHDTLIPNKLQDKTGFKSDIDSDIRGRARAAGREILYATLFYFLYQAIRAYAKAHADDDKDKTGLEGMLTTGEYWMLGALIKVTNESRSLVPVPVIGKIDDYITNFGQLTSAFKEATTLAHLAENFIWYTGNELFDSPFAYERGYYQRATDRWEGGSPKMYKNLYDLTGLSNIEDTWDPVTSVKRNIRNK